MENKPTKAPHWRGIPLRSIPASGLGRCSCPVTTWLNVLTSAIYLQLWIALNTPNI
jgi:hypothetical protein